MSEPQQKKKLRSKTAVHQQTALPLHTLIVCIFGALALVCIIGGIVALFQKSESKTQFDIMGAHLSTGSVGVAFVGIGLLMAYFTIRSVLNNQRELAGLRHQNSPKIANAAPSKMEADASGRDVTTITQSNITTGGDNAGRDIIKN